MTYENLESFTLIQEILFEENKLILRGYSNDSKLWLEFFFEDYEYKIIEF